jgi:hypothetical protein
VVVADIHGTISGGPKREPIDKDRPPEQRELVTAVDLLDMEVPRVRAGTIVRITGS